MSCLLLVETPPPNLQSYLEGAENRISYGFCWWGKGQFCASSPALRELGEAATPQEALSHRAALTWPFVTSSLDSPLVHLRIPPKVLTTLV